VTAFEGTPRCRALERVAVENNESARRFEAQLPEGVAVLRYSLGPTAHGVVIPRCPALRHRACHAT